MRLSFPEMLLAGGVGATATGTGSAVETALANYTVPAGLMTANGRIEIITEWSCTNSGNNKIPKVRWGATGITGTTFSSVTLTTSATARLITVIANNNSVSAQVGGSTGVTYGSSSGASVSDNQNTSTTAQLIAITGTVTTNAETITLLSYSIRLYNH